MNTYAKFLDGDIYTIVPQIGNEIVLQAEHKLFDGLLIALEDATLFGQYLETINILPTITPTMVIITDDDLIFQYKDSINEEID